MCQRCGMADNAPGPRRTRKHVDRPSTLASSVAVLLLRVRCKWNATASTPRSPGPDLLVAGLQWARLPEHRAQFPAQCPAACARTRTGPVARRPADVGC